MNDPLYKDLPPPPGAEPQHHHPASLSSASGASHHTASSSPLPTAATTSPPLHHASLRQHHVSASPRSNAIPLSGSRESAQDLPGPGSSSHQHQQLASGGTSAVVGPSTTSPTTPGGLFSRLYITLVRHAESEDNASATWAGAGRDAPLTTLGKEQARALGKAFADVRLEGVYASDLLRAKGTAEEVVTASRYDPKPPLVQARALREQHFGVSEGRPWKDVAAELDPSQRSFVFPEGESLEQVNARVASAARRYVLPRLESLASSGAPGSAAGERVEHIMIVSHGITTSELLRVFLGLHNPPPGLGSFPDPRPGFKRAPLDNTGWTRLELAVPLLSSSTVLEGGRRDGEGGLTSAEGASSEAKKHILVRVMEQNNIDHLVQLAEERAQATLYGGDRPLLSESNALGLSPSSGTAPGPSGPSQRTLSAYDGRFVLRELERAGGGSGMLSAYGAGGMAVLASGSAGSSATVGTSSRQAVEPSGASSTGHGMAPSSTASLAFLDASSTSDVWQNVCVRVLPLFNGEGLRSPIEELNEGVSAHIRRVLDRSPARALQKLAADLTSLLSAGMYTLNAKLPRSSRGTLQTGPFETSRGLRMPFAASADDVRLLTRLAEVWTFFYGSVVPYLEGCFLPLETDPVLLSLTNDKENTNPSTLSGGGGLGAKPMTASMGAASSVNGASVSMPSTSASSATITGNVATSAANGASSTTSVGQGTGVNPSGSANAASTGVASLIRTEKIEVRATALRVFRDGVVLPLFDHLVPLLSHIGEIDGAASSRSALSVGHELAREEQNGVGGSSPSSKLEARRRSEEESSARLQPRLLQLTSVLCGILSSDAKQDAMDALRKALRRGSNLSSSVGANGGLGAADDVQQLQQQGPAFFAAKGSATDLAGGGASELGIRDVKENRRGWIPRSAAKHGIMAEEQQQQQLLGLEPDGGLRVPLSGRSGDATTSAATAAALAGNGTLSAFGMTEDDYLGTLRSPTVSSPGTARVGRSGSSGGPQRTASTGRARSEPDSSIDSIAQRRISSPPQIGRLGTYDYVEEGQEEEEQRSQAGGIDGVSMAWLRQQEALRREAASKAATATATSAESQDPNAPAAGQLPPPLVQTPEEDPTLSTDVPTSLLTEAPPDFEDSARLAPTSLAAVHSDAGRAPPPPSLTTGLMPGGFGGIESYDDGDEAEGTPVQRQGPHWEAFTSAPR